MAARNARNYISDPRYQRRLDDNFGATAVDGSSPRGVAGEGSPHATGTSGAGADAIGGASPRRAADEGSARAAGTPSDSEPSYWGVIGGTAPAEPADLDALTLSRFLHDAAARGTRLAPDFLKSTEIHVICRPVPGFLDRGFVAHYTRFNHSLELRAEIDLPEDFLGEGIACEGWFLVGLSTAFTKLPPRPGSDDFGGVEVLDRNVELGHTVASVAFAAAAMGWEARLLGPSLGFEALKRLLGLRSKTDLVNEMPVAAILVFRPRNNPDDEAVLQVRLLKSKIIEFFNDGVQWRGCPCSVNSPKEGEHTLSRSMVWTESTWGAEEVRLDRMLPGITAQGFEYKTRATLRGALDSRGSITPAEFDDNYGMPLAHFQQIILRCCPGDVVEADGDGWHPIFPHGVLPWTPRVNVFFYVNRVDGLEPGLYCLVRNRGHLETDPAGASDPAPEPALSPTSTSGVPHLEPPYLWKPTILGHPALTESFYLFRQRDGSVTPPLFKNDHKKSSFLVAMVAPYHDVIGKYYMHSRQMWEAGFLGEVLAVEAQALGVAAPLVRKSDYHFGFLKTALGINTTSGDVISLYAVGKDTEGSRNRLLKALGCFCPCLA